MRTARFTIRLKGSGLNVTDTIFEEMDEVEGELYHFLLPASALGKEHLEYLENSFEILLKRPVACEARLVVLGDEHSVIYYRGILDEAFYESKFSWWNKEDQQSKREAVCRMSAAKLQVEHPDLDFEWCYALAQDVLSLRMEEKQPLRLFQKIYLQNTIQQNVLLSGELLMETEDHSGFRMRVRQSDVERIRASLFSLRGHGPVHLIVR